MFGQRTGGLRHAHQVADLDALQHKHSGLEGYTGRAGWPPREPGCGGGPALGQGGAAPRSEHPGEVGAQHRVHSRHHAVHHEAVDVCLPPLEAASNGSARAVIEEQEVCGVRHAAARRYPRPPGDLRSGEVTKGSWHCSEDAGGQGRRDSARGCARHRLPVAAHGWRVLCEDHTRAAQEYSATGPHCRGPFGAFAASRGVLPR
mmetsp:Transcript_65792/g.186812  ORF Transcript_65792/g.186812 Transcript_65792/m.186812 type:complete len:203 (+) Transcript_65792:2522-3130(+)